MRLLSVTSASLALTAVVGAHAAESTVAVAEKASVQRPVPTACDEPGPTTHHAVLRWHRYARFRAHHQRRWSSMEIVPPEPPDFYNPPLPSPYDPAYDRAMTLHFRSPGVSGSYLVEPGFPPTPPVAGILPYRVRDERAVYQYDGLIGEYVALARSDASRAVAAVPLPP